MCNFEYDLRKKLNVISHTFLLNKKSYIMQKNLSEAPWSVGAFCAALKFRTPYPQNVLGMRVGVFFCFEYIEDEVCEKFKSGAKSADTPGSFAQKRVKHLLHFFALNMMMMWGAKNLRAVHNSRAHSRELRSKESLF